MSIRLRGCATTVWSATGTTIPGGVLFVGIIGQGSAALGTIQVSDGTRNIFNLGLNITAGNSFVPSLPIALSSALITTVLSTAGYSICYMPKP